MIDANSITLAVASFAFSAFVTYALWAWVRVLFIRQELFTVRDGLWDRARELGGFEDPAYRQAREHLNAAIKVVPSFSVRLLNYMTKNGPQGTIVRLKSDNPELQAAIDKAYNDCGRWFAKYILYWRASGWLFMLTTSLKAIQDMTIRWLQTQGPTEFGELDAMVNSRWQAG